MIKKLILSTFTALLSFSTLQGSVEAGVIRVPFTLAAGTNTTQNYNFGDVGVGQYVYATFTYKNTSSSDLQITGSSTEGSVDIVSSDCGGTLDAQATCNVIVGFTVSDLGVNSGAVKFTTNLYQKPDIFSVSASGISPSSVLSINPSSAAYSFSSEEKTFTISNPRNYAIKIDNIIPSSNYWAITGNNCKTELQPNDKCVVTAKYSTSKQGTYSASLKITSQSLTVGQAALTASSQYGSPGFSVNAISLPTLMVGVPYTGDLSVTNTGKGNLIIPEVLFESPSSALSFPKNDCNNKTLAPNESCSLQYRVLFTTATSLQSGISFRFSNSTTSYSTVGMFASAIAVNPILSVTPSILDFGKNTADQIKTQNLTLKSIGNSTVNVSDIKIAGNAAFTLVNKNSCVGALTEGNQCILTVQFKAPVVTGETTQSGTISFVSSSTVPVNSVSLNAKTLKAVFLATPITQTITGQAGQSYFKEFLVTNTSSVSAPITQIVSNNTIYSLTGSSCQAGQVLEAGVTCTVKVNLNNAVAGTGSGNITLKYGSVDALTLGVTHNIEAVYATAEVGDISCPDVSASTALTSVSLTQFSPYVCSLFITNPGTSPLYLPNSSFNYAANTGGFLVVNGQQLMSAGIFGYRLEPNSKTKITFTHSVPSTPGNISAEIGFKIYGKMASESSATSFKRTAQVNVLAADHALTDVVCPSSVYVTQAITCTATIYNRSLTEFSPILGGSNVLTNSNQIAAKYSQSFVDGIAVSTLATLKPAKDTLSSAFNGATPGFYWSTVSPTNCTQGSSFGKIVPGGKCSASITFKPTIAGAYSIPLFLVSTKDSSQWVTSNSNATFVAKKATLDLTATPFECTPVYPNTPGVCTTTMTNATPVGVNNTYPVPSIAVSGGSAGVITKTPTGIVKTTTTCPAVGIAPGATCKLSVTFTSTTPGTFVGKATLTSKGEADAVDLVPTVLVPDISLSAFVCPDAAVGEAGTCTATFKNSMTTSVSISSVSKLNVAGFDNPSAAAMTIPANQSTTIRLSYKFLAAGTFANTISVNTNYGIVSAPVSLTTQDYPAAEASLSPFTCPVLYYGQSAKCTATLTNLSSRKSLPVNGVTLLNNKHFTVFTGASHDCGRQVAPKGTCTVSVSVAGVSGGGSTISVDAQVSTNPVLTQVVNLDLKSVLFSVIKPPVQRVSANTEARIVIGFRNETPVAVPVFEKNMSWATKVLKTGGFYLIKNECSGTKAPQEVCNLTLGLKTAVAGYVTGTATMNYGSGFATTDFIVEVVVPKLDVSLAYSTSSINVGVGSKSGNWYKVTNQSPETITLSKFTPLANTVLLMDSKVGGNCFVGKLLGPNESCLFLDTLSASSLVTNPLKLTGVSSVEATNKLKGIWSPTYIVNLAKLEMGTGATSLFGIVGEPIVGQLKLTNTTDGPLRGISISQAFSSSVKGDFRWTDAGCSAEVPRNGICYQSFVYQPAVGDNGSLTFTATGTFARLINGAQQDWGDTVTIAKLVLGVKAEKPLAYVPNVTFTPLEPFGAPSEEIIKEVYIYNKGKVDFKILNVILRSTPDIELFNPSNCLNKVLKPNESCFVMSKYKSNRISYNAPAATVEYVISGGDSYIAKLTVVAPPNQSKICTFGESSSYTSVFTGCARNASAFNGPAACTPAYNWNSWLDPIFFNGLAEYNDNKLVTPAKALTWKSSGLPVTQVITKVGNVSYGFNVKPILQIYMGGKWTDMWGGSGSSGTALARSRSNGIYNYGFGAWTTFAVPADVGGGANPLYAPNGSPYTEFISVGTTIGGYAARQAWVEVTPGPYCHQPGSYSAR